MQRDPNEEQERRPRSSRRSDPGFPVAPALLVVVLIAVGYFGSQMIAASTAPPPSPEAQGYVPFSAVPEEAPPDISGRPGMKWVDNAPAGLAGSHVPFAEARTLAAQGEKFLDEARAADASGESTEARALRKQAHTAYNDAFTDTAEWEFEIVAAYSDKDKQVRDIQRERSRWMSRIIALHKTTGR